MISFPELPDTELLEHVTPFRLVPMGTDPYAPGFLSRDEEFALEFHSASRVCVINVIGLASYRLGERAELPRLPLYGFLLQCSLTEQGGIEMANLDGFLSTISSTGKNKYKRYTNSPLRYAGGKSLAVGFVIEQFSPNIKKLVSPFIGGGSIEVAAALELDIPVIGYDVFDILTNYWNQQIQFPTKLANKLDKWEPNKNEYNQIKKALKAHWTGEKKIKSPLSLAAHYWFNHNLSYGPGFLGWMSKIYEDKNRYERLVDRVRKFECPNLSVEAGGFEKTIPKHRRNFLYCDPPYYLNGNSKMFRGIYPQRNFPIHHNGFNHEKLRDLLHKHKGGFVLSYNDCDTIRKWYSCFDIVEVHWQYTLGQGETRIGKNRIENGSRHHVKKSHELLIIGEKR